jgi:DNA-binding MarR family transcriptional regulator
MKQASEEVAQWLREHPGHHRPRDVAAAMGYDPRRTAQNLRYLWERGRIDRLVMRRPGYTRELGLYGTEDGNVRPASITLINRYRKQHDTTPVLVKVPPPGADSMKKETA